MLSMFPEAVQKSLTTQAEQVLAFQRRALQAQLAAFDWQLERLNEVRTHSLAGLDLGQRLARDGYQRAQEALLDSMAPASAEASN